MISEFRVLAGSSKKIHAVEGVGHYIGAPKEAVKQTLSLIVIHIWMSRASIIY